MRGILKYLALVSLFLGVVLAMRELCELVPDFSQAAAVSSAHASLK